MTRSEMLERARELIELADEIIDVATNDLPIRRHYEAYGKYGINQLLNKGNPYDDGLEELIEATNEDKEDHPEWSADYGEIMI